MQTSRYNFVTALIALLVLPWLLGPQEAQAQADAAEIARKLNNPIASLISLPMQFNYDTALGPDGEGDRFLMNVQPVIPIGISKDWNLISRTIVPLVQLNGVPPGNDESGIGDVFQSLFFSPKAPTADGWVWGAGPALLIPTATDELLGAEKWAIGPTAVALKQSHGWTYGALTNHVWSFAGSDNRADVNATLLQPFVSLTLPSLMTFSLNTESTYDWEGEDWSVPINIGVSQLFKVGKQMQTIQFGARYWLDSPDGAAEGWGVRLTYTLVFPR
jgi:hypothetical protein